MKKNKKHGLSLIELVCIIVIVGLLVTMIVLAVIKMLEESKVNEKLVQEELINEACKSYIIKNNDKAPKIIGDSVNVKLKTLKEENYLDKAIYDANNNSCMENSYVRVYKLNPKEYTYLPYLYCGDEEVSEVESLPTPSVNILFIDSNDQDSNDLIFNNIDQSRIYIEMNGGVDNFGRQIELDTYEITIYIRTKNNSNLIEKYNSGVLSANRKTIYTIDKKVMSYINTKEATSINVVVKTTNTLGGVSEVTSIAQTSNKEN